jgi:predicted nucleic acid-binding protein
MQYIHTMRILVDASAILSALLNEATKGKIVAKTKDAILIAPSSIHWEICNAVSSLVKRKKISGAEGVQVVEEYLKIPIQHVDIDLKEAISVAGRHSMYAYDAYMIVGAKHYRLPLLSLDAGLNDVAKKEKVKLVEV